MCRKKNYLLPPCSKIIISILFPDTTEAFYTTVLNKVRNVHYNNWFAWRTWVDRVPLKRENDNAEEEDYNMLNDYVETKYDPST